MWTLGGRTPEEAWTGKEPPETLPVRANDPLQPLFRVARHPFRGDPRLPVMEIEITRQLKRTG